MKSFNEAWLKMVQMTTERTRAYGSRVIRWAGQSRSYDWRDMLTQNTLASIAAIAIVAFLAGVAVSLKREVLASIPVAGSFFPWSTKAQSAVMAVDANGLTIRTDNGGAIDAYEQATVEQLAQLHPIYAAWAREHHDLVGSLVIKLAVGKSGKVVAANTVAARPPNRDFTKVILGEMRQWSYPPGDAERIDITIPLIFVPKGMDPSTIVQWERKTRAAENVSKSAAAARARKSPAASSSADKRAGAPPALDGGRDNRRQAVRLGGQNHGSAKAPAPSVETTQAVGLRDQPRFSAKRVHEIEAETKLSVIENKGDWLRVKVADNGRSGFVRKEFIAPLN